MTLGARERRHQPSPARSWPDFRVALLISALALLPRLYVAIAWTAEPVWDGHYYHFGGTRIADGLGYSEDVDVGGVLQWRPWCHYPVGYSAWLGGLYRLFGQGLLVAPLANACIGALTVLLTHFVASRYLSVSRARLAAALVALHPGLILYTGVVMSEPLAAFLAIVPLAIALAFQKRWWIATLGAGIAIGLGALVRPLPALFSIPLLALVVEPHAALRAGRGALQRMAQAGACVGAVSLAALVVILPWTIRNCRTMDGCALISTNGGWNLAIGALTPTGRFHTLRAADGCAVVTGQVQQDRCWAHVGMTTIAEDPGHWFGLIDDKLRHTYNHESFAVEYLREANPRVWPEATRQRAKEISTLFHHVVMIFAAMGVIGLPLRFERAGRGNQPSQRWPRVSCLKSIPAWCSQGVLAALLLWLVAYAADAEGHPLFWSVVFAPVFAWLPLPGRPRQGPVAAFAFGLVLATTVTHAVFFGDDRYHLVVSPVLCLLAAAALRPSQQWTRASRVQLPRGARLLPSLSLALGLSLLTTKASAFDYIVHEGDSLANLAHRFYGSLEYEHVLVSANHLDALGGTRILPGMLLEIPAVRYQRVSRQDTWEQLAEELLGAKHRSVVLAQVNGSKPWLPLEDGAEIIIPFNLHLVATTRDNLVELARRFLGDQKQAWTIAHYNDLKSGALTPGQSILIPLARLQLTEQGSAAASRAATWLGQQAAGAVRKTQQEAREELPRLARAVREGRYVDAVRLGTQLLGSGQLTKPQTAGTHRLLLEAYVALGSTGNAVFACSQWLKYAPHLELDPAWLSPKLLDTCLKTPEALGRVRSHQ